MNEPSNALARVPYDNYKIIHPDNTLMCFCSKKKANWYLRNGLATLEDGNRVMLNFIPKGYGDPIEILTGRSNCCVVTGTQDNLTKHHVVPTQYRQHFPAAYKDKNSCDLVVLTREKHDEYENQANDLKARLYADYVDDIYLDLQVAWSEARSIYSCIKNYYDRLPDEKQIYMNVRLDGLMERYGFTDIELANGELTGNKDYNVLIVERVGVENMIILWKLHFIKYGKPLYLPEWWKPNLLKVINREDRNRKTDMVLIDMNTRPELLQMLNKYELYEIARLHL